MFVTFFELEKFILSSVGSVYKEKYYGYFYYNSVTGQKIPLNGVRTWILKMKVQKI